MKKEYLMSRKSRVGLGNAITHVLKTSNPRYPVRFNTSTPRTKYSRRISGSSLGAVTSIHIQWAGNDYFLMVSIDEDVLIHSVSKCGSIEWNYSEQVISKVTSIEVVYEALRLISQHFDDFTIETRKSRIGYICRNCKQSFKTFNSAVEHKKGNENHYLLRRKA